MKILVPIDFTEVSFNAYFHAAHLAVTLQAEVTLLHVIAGGFNTNSALPYEPIQEMKSVAKNRMKYFMEDYPEKQGISIPKINVHKEVRFGVPGFVISDMSSDAGFDLIVMGSRDHHGVLDRILGTSSILTARLAACPVLLIHENTRFNAIQKIVFGFDNEGDLPSALDAFRKINDKLLANTDFIHVEEEDEKELNKQTQEIVRQMVETKEIGFSFEIKKIRGRSKSDVLTDYCISTKADMLALVHKKEGMFSALFGENFSLKIAQRFHLPLLILHEKK